MSRTLEASPPEVDLKTLRKVILAASIGNFVEWFDFAAYGFLATILTTRVFPERRPGCRTAQDLRRFRRGVCIPAAGRHCVWRDW